MAKSDTHIASLHLIGTLITCWCSTTTTLLLICLDNCNSLLIYLSRFNTAQLKHSLNTWSSMIIHDQALMFSRVHVNGTPMGAHQAASSNRLTFPIVNLSAASLPRIFACFDGVGVTPAAVSVWRKLGCFLIFGIFDIEKTIHEKNPWTRCFFEVHETNARNCLPYMAWRCIFHMVSLGNPSFYRKTIKKNMANKTSRVVYYGGPMEVSNYCSFVSWFTSWNNPFTSCTMDIPIVWPLLKEMNTIWLCRFFFEHLLASPPSGFSREPMVFSKYIKGDFMVPSTDQWDWFVYLQWMVDFYGVFVDIPFVTWIPKRSILLMEEIPNYMNGWFLWFASR